MKLRFLLVLMLPISLMAQDILIKRNGQEVKTRIIDIGKKQITYKVIDDPEFQTQTVNKKDVRMIRMEEGKIYDYDRIYPAPYIGIGGGLWAPAGRFGSSESNGESTPGYAKSGLQFKIGTGFYLGRKLGIALEARFAGSEFHSSDYDATLESNSTFSDQSTDGNRYNFSTVYVGPMYSTMLSKKLTLDVKAMGGLFFLQHRTQHTKYFFNGSTSPVVDNIFEYDAALTLGGGLGINLRYTLAPHLNIGLYGDYVQASPKVAFTNTILDHTNIPVEIRTETKGSIDRSITGFGLGLNVAYQFNRRKDW